MYTVVDIDPRHFAGRLEAGDIPRCLSGPEDAMRPADRSLVLAGEPASLFCDVRHALSALPKQSLRRSRFIAHKKKAGRMARFLIAALTRPAYIACARAPAWCG